MCYNCEEESFDPTDAIKEWKNKAPEWNLPRDWW